jgi:hypothetical protein
VVFEPGVGFITHCFTLGVHVLQSCFSLNIDTPCFVFILRCVIIVIFLTSALIFLGSLHFGIRGWNWLNFLNLSFSHSSLLLIEVGGCIYSSHVSITTSSEGCINFIQLSTWKYLIQLLLIRVVHY